MKKLLAIIAIIISLPIVGHAALTPTSWLRDTVAGFLRPNITTDTLRIPSLTSCDTIDTDADGDFICGTDGGGGGGSTALDLGDNGSNESSGITEIAVTGDTNSIFTEPSADKLLIAVGNDWPKADTADDLTCTDCIGTIEIADSYVLNTGDTVTGDLYVNALLQVGNGATSGGEIRIYEDTDNGSNFLSFLAPTSIGSDRTCQLANLAPFIPDSCVGNGTDDTGLTSVSWGDILGTISSQADLQAELDAKLTIALSDGRIWIGDAGGFAAEASVSGDVTIDNTGVTTIGANKILESMLKAVDSPADEEFLTYESTTGDFEWQAGGGGSFDSTTVDATTWSDGANASNIWTFDLSGTDTTLTFGSGLFTFGGAVTASGKVIADASLDIKNGATSSGILAIFEDSDNGTNKATFQAPALAADTVYTLPADDGDASEVLTTNGSGTLTWETAAGSGDVTAVGNCATGACFTGTSGSNLVFDNAGGDGEIDYNGTQFAMDKPIALGSAGVRLTGDGDGAITFLGLGNGSDEDLTLNLDDTSNTGVFTSSTGLNSISWSSIGQTITIADNTNITGLTINNNDVTNFPEALEIISAVGGNTDIGMTNTSTGAEGSYFSFFHNSASPANQDVLGGFLYSGKDSAANTTLYTGLSSFITDTTNGSEDAAYTMSAVLAGTFRTLFKVGDGVNGITVGNSTVGNGVVSSAGSSDLVLQTGNATTGTLTLADGANGNLNFAPNGTGELQVSGDNVMYRCVELGLDPYSNITTGTRKDSFIMPFAMTVTHVYASLTTGPTGSVATFDINEDTDREGASAATTILSTKLTIDASEYSSQSAATPAVISDTALAKGSEISLDTDGVGSTTPGNGIHTQVCGNINY